MRVNSPRISLLTISKVILALLTVVHTYCTVAYGDDVPMRIPIMSVASSAIPGKSNSFSGAVIAATVFGPENKTSSLHVLFTRDVNRPIQEWNEEQISKVSNGDSCPHLLTPVLYNNAIRGGGKADMHLFFICANSLNGGGALVHSTSSDSGNTWSVPVKLVHVKNTGLLLASYTLVDKGAVVGSEWYLVALDSALDIIIIHLKSNGTVLHSVSTASSIKGGKLYNSVFPYDNLGDNHPSVGAIIVREDIAMKFNSIESHALTDWHIFSNNDETYMPSKNNKNANFIPRFAAASSVIPISPACGTVDKRSMNLYITAAVSSDGSAITYGSANSVDGLLKGSKGYRALGDYRVKGTLAPVIGLAAALLPPFVTTQDAKRQCPYEQGRKDVIDGTRAIIAAIVGDGSRPLRSSVDLQISIVPLPNTPNAHVRSDGEPTLAAAVTFIILGTVLIGLLGVFVVGFCRRRNTNESSEESGLAVEKSN